MVQSPAVIAQTWTQTGAPSNFWASVASSADGTKLVAAVGGGALGGIYVTTNSGITWMLTSAPVLNWASVACSADGSKFVAADHLEYGIAPGSLYTSTNGGATWTAGILGSGFWRSVAASADGIELVAVASITTSRGGPRGLISSSTDSGATWTQASVPDINWFSVASSAGGTKLVAAAAFDSLYTSTNPTVSWTATTAPNLDWSSIASSADGSKLVASASTYGYNTGAIYTSTNSGSTWTLTSAPALDWISVASSADGTKLVAAAKKVGLFAAGVATQKYMQAIQDQQEIMGAIANMVIETYAMESAVLRAQKLAARNGEAGAANAIAMTRVYMTGAMERIESAAKTVIAASAEGDMLRSQLAILRRLCKYEPFNTIALREQIAQRVIEAGKYQLA